MKKIILFAAGFFLSVLSFSQKDSTVSKKDRRKDVSLETSMGTMIIRLSDSTPLHRDNFLKLVKTGYYDGIIFHRVIKDFMIQGGDPNSKTAKPGEPLGNGGPGYLVPAEFRQTLFHKKGVIAAARSNNPEKASSGSQFYIAQGKIYTEAGLDSLETTRLQGQKIPALYRAAYTTVGGIPHLDKNYTVYGEVVRGMEVLDEIAAVETSKGTNRDRPLVDVKILEAKLVKRKKTR